MAVSLAIGLGFGKRQRPWAELSDKERKLMIEPIARGGIALAWWNSGISVTQRLVCYSFSVAFLSRGSAVLLTQVLE